MSTLSSLPLAVLESMAQRLNAKLQQIVEHTHLTWAPDLERQLRLVQSRAAEVQSKAFVIIVVGPVKSGKSTFVNLLAHEKVSPMDYLECTTRPSVISQRSAGQESTITTFKLRQDEKETVHTAQYVESIIDYLKGLQGSTLDGVETSVVPLTPESLKDKVEMPANFELLDPAHANQNLMTSITARGGDFLGENIYLVDMPGFDGLIANLAKNEDYATITRRADLIVFIQSTNSAIGKIQEEFFEMICNGNSQVPVCLVHNIYASAYWRSPEEQLEAVKRHEHSAVRLIRSKGFNLSDECCFCINLGMVSDAEEGETSRVQEQYRPLLDEATASFRVIEQRLHDQIITSKSNTRLANCMHRAEEERDRLVQMIDLQIGELHQKQAEYDELVGKLNEGAKDVHHCYDALRLKMAIDWSPLMNQLSGKIGTFVDKNVEDRRYSREEVRQLVRDLMGQYETLLRGYVTKCFEMPKKVDELAKMSQARQFEISKLFFGLTKAEVPELEHTFDEPLPSLDTKALAQYYDVEKNVNKSALKFWGYNYDEVRSILERVHYIIIGTDARLNDFIPDGKLASDMAPRIEQQLQTAVQSYVEHRREAYAAYYAQLRAKTLDVSQPAASYDDMINQLSVLKEKLQNLQK